LFLFDRTCKPPASHFEKTARIPHPKLKKTEGIPPHIGIPHYIYLHSSQPKKKGKEETVAYATQTQTRLFQEPGIVLRKRGLLGERGRKA